MSHVVTRACCSDATCVAACPVNCIHPTQDEPGYATSEMLYIDPEACIDCGACVDVCPVDAIMPDYDLTSSTQVYADLNARYFLGAVAAAPAKAESTMQRPPIIVTEPGPLRVAVVGSGPAGCFAAEELLAHDGLAVEVDIFDRLPVPWGLVRFGVAPDHQDTKSVARLFARTAARRGLHMHLNVEVGTHLTHAELLAHHHAVIYAVGASGDRRMEVPGEQFSGSHSATEFVAWYNGHPDFAHHTFDLSGPRAVVVGNGNVALDVARVLATDPQRLARTDIADHALRALADSAITDVVVLGRRGPEQASFTVPELLALADSSGYGLFVELGEDHAARSDNRDPIASMKADLLRDLAVHPRNPGARRRIVLRFQSAPVEVLGGNGRVLGLRVVHNELITGPDGRIVGRPSGATEEIDCGLVLRSIGFRGRPMPGVPFDDARGLIPNAGGRVLDDVAAAPLPGVYTTGWIKRGPSGVIGTNRRCAQETVRALLDDHSTGRLPSPSHDHQDLTTLIRERQPRELDYTAWKTIDIHERALGRQQQRPRTKLVDVDQIVRIAAPTGPLS